MKDAFLKQFVRLDHDPLSGRRSVVITSPDDGIHERRTVRFDVPNGVTDADITSQVCAVLERWAEVFIDTTREASQDVLGLTDLADSQRRKIAMTVTQERVVSRVRA